MTITLTAKHQVFRSESVVRPVVNHQKDVSLIEADDVLAIYLKEAAQTPLLSPVEEVALAKQIEQGHWAEKKLAKTTCNFAEAEQLNSYIKEANQARDHLIKANTRLVVSVAKKYRGRGLPLVDLIQEGNLGLMKAVEKFDYRRGGKFSTYAIWWIRQTVSRGLTNQGRTIRIPVHLNEHLLKLSQVSCQLEQSLGRKPTPDELAGATGLELSQVDKVLRVGQYLGSLDWPLGEAEDATLEDFIEDESIPSPPEVVDYRLLRVKLEKALARLKPREARILRLRFGLEDGQSYTLEEVGQKFALTRERIRQIESKALDKLRQSEYIGELREYLE